MDEVTEIYICTEGQQLKDGILEVSNSIKDRSAAEYDAREKCRFDKSIYKIAYYRSSANGDCRVFYTYTNPRMVATTLPSHKVVPSTKKQKKKKKAKSVSLMGKVKKLFK